MWIVMEAQIGSRERFWAWCKPYADGSSGFEAIDFTARDGITMHSPSEPGLPQLGAYLFTVPDQVEVLAEVGQLRTFPEQFDEQPAEPGPGVEGEAESDAGDD